MRFFKATILTASVVVSILALGLSGIDLASATPLGAAGKAGNGGGTLLIQVQAGPVGGAPPVAGQGGGAPSGNTGGGAPTGNQGNKQGNNQGKGGGVPAGKGGTGNNHNGRNGAVAAGVLGGIIGGIIATQPRPAEPVYEDDDEGPRYRCRFGSYIGRDGYRHCRQ